MTLVKHVMAVTSPNGDPAQETRATTALRP
jgi:hypothetical protein